MFGCGKRIGNSVSFVQEIQNVSFPDALRYIANKYNIEIIEENLTKEQELRLSKKVNLLQQNLPRSISRHFMEF